MSGLVSILSTPVNLMEKLLHVIRNYRKKKRIEIRFVKAFEHEIRTYIDIFGRMSEIAEKQIAPILESIEDELSPHTMNDLLEASSQMPLVFAELIEAFISFGKACSEVVVIEGFMEDLKETNIMLYDYVLVMKRAYIEEDRLKIDGKYYRFFKTYENEIFGKVDFSDLEEGLTGLKRLIRRIRQFMEKTALIKRTIRKRYAKNLGVLAKTADKLTIGRTLIINLRTYVPKKLLPIAIFIEDFALKTRIPKRARK